MASLPNSNTTVQSSKGQDYASLFRFELETVTKATALLAATAYILGYLILTFNETSHGFLDTGLVKPRAITVGAAFLLLLALPISFSGSAFFEKQIEVETCLQTLTRWSLGLTAILSAGLVTAFITLMFFADSTAGTPLSGQKYVGIFFLIWAIPLNLLLTSSLRNNYHIRSACWLLASLTLLGALALGAYLLRSLAVMRYVGWVFVIVVLIQAVRGDMRRGIRFKLNFIPLAVSLIGIISSYSLIVFPYLKPEVGGGYPRRATVYVSKESPVHGGESCDVEVLESSDSGFYFTFNDEKNVTYIPQNFVTALQFSSKTGK